VHIEGGARAFSSRSLSHIKIERAFSYQGQRLERASKVLVLDLNLKQRLPRKHKSAL
jgi:hypothetical protein